MAGRDNGRSWGNDVTPALFQNGPEPGSRLVSFHPRHLKAATGHSDTRLYHGCLRPISRSSFSHLATSLSYWAVDMPLSGYQSLKLTGLKGLPYSRSARIFCASGLNRKSANSAAALGCGAWATKATPPAFVGTTSMGTQSIGAPLDFDSRAWSRKIVGEIPTSPEITISAMARPETECRVIS